MFTDDGRMLVDGGIVDNIPLTPMKPLKSGPNLIVHFGMPPTQPYTIKYESIPGRWRLLCRLLNPLARKKLPDAPGPKDAARLGPELVRKAERVVTAWLDELRP
jgi:NTE family protein